jgi:hypothetical protein
MGVNEGHNLHDGEWELYRVGHSWSPRCRRMAAAIKVVTLAIAEF